MSDVYKSTGSGFSIVGRVETGQLRVGDKVLVQPQGEIAQIKSEYFLKLINKKKKPKMATLMILRY